MRVAIIAMQPRKTVGHVAAGQEALELPQDEMRQAATRKREPIEEDGQPLTDNGVESIAGRSSVLDGRRHEGARSKDRTNGTKRRIVCFG